MENSFEKFRTLLQLERAEWFNRAAGVGFFPVFLSAQDNRLTEDLARGCRPFLRRSSAHGESAKLRWFALSSENAVFSSGDSIWKIDRNGDAHALLGPGRPLAAVVSNPDRTRDAVLTLTVESATAASADPPEQYKLKFPGKGGHEVCDRILRAIHPRARIVVAVFGAPGVGKSTLINAVLQRECAKTGAGLPVTAQTRWYESETGDLALVDTQGWTRSETLDEAYDRLSGAFNLCERAGAGYAIDAVWYCLAYGPGRLQPAEVQLLRKVVAAHGHVKMVVLRSPVARDPNDEFLREIYRHIPEDDVHFVNAREEKRGLLENPVHGLAELLAATRQVAEL